MFENIDLTVIRSYLEYKFIGNYIWQYGLFFLILVCIFIIKKIAEFTVLKKIKKIAYNTEFQIDNLLYNAAVKPFDIFVYLTGFNFALSLLIIPKKFLTFTENTITVCFYATATYFFYNIVDIFEYYFKEFAERTRSEIDTDILNPVKKTVKLVIVIIGTIITAENIGYDLTGIIAGLGVGGIAISLAAKDTISNLFGSFTVFADNPFKTGDHIDVKGCCGRVVSIGIRSTKIQTDEGCIISVPNASFVSSTIKNISKQDRYIINGSITITHNNSAEKVTACKNIVKNIIEKMECNDASCAVWTEKYGGNTIDVHYTFSVLTLPWNEFLKVRESFQINVAQALDEQRIEMSSIQ